MAIAVRRPTLAGMHELRSGDAVFWTGADHRIRDWNAACERLTGIRAAEAEGRPCWEVIAGRDPDGGIVCHPGCSILRLAPQGWPVRCVDVEMPTRFGRKRVTVSTIVVRDETQTMILHPLRETVEAPIAAATDHLPRLTRRQREILRLLAEGVRVRQIADRLTLSEATVRNHVRAILRALGAHSQLEAVARAHALSLDREEPAA